MNPPVARAGRFDSGRLLCPIRFLLRLSAVLLLLGVVAGCATPGNRYLLLEESLRVGDTTRAADIVEKAAPEYGAESQVLYRMDRGMILHLAGQYQASTAALEQADDLVERLYSRRLRTEATAFLTNDSKLPFEGEPYEQTMLNIVKALNYAAMGNLNEALVEARRLDHRLNLLRDRVGDKEAYHGDPFGRYVSGVLYEAAGDLNNAFIAYRHAYDDYRDAASWARTPMPPQLRADLLRLSDALHFADEHEAFTRQFPDVVWQKEETLQGLGQVVVVAYNGRAPRKEDQFVDVPVSLEALNLVLLTKVIGGGHPHTQERRAAESVLYGLNGRVVRIALPYLVPQKSQIAYEDVQLIGAGATVAARTELAENVTAMADKALAAHLKGTAVKAVARAITKFGLAEGIGRGARAAAGNDAGPLVGLAVGAIAKAIAVASEEADKRLWRTLPDEIQIGRVWVPPGEYQLKVQPVGRGGGPAGRELLRPVAIEAGRTQIIIHRAVN